MSINYSMSGDNDYGGGIGTDTTTYAEPSVSMEPIGGGDKTPVAYAETNRTRKAANVDRPVASPVQGGDEAENIADAATQEVDSTGETLDSISSIVQGTLSNVLGEWRSSNSREAQQGYAEDLAEWRQTGRGYFDPSVDVTPELSMFLDQVPSKVEALEGELIIGDMAEDDNAIGWIANPAGNLVAATGLWDEGKASYVGEQTWMDAVNGYIEGSQSDGWVGGVVQAVLDGVMGLFSHGSNYDEAVAADKKRMEQVRKRYELAMKRWLLQRWKRQQGQAEEARKHMARALSHEKEKKKAKKAEREAGQITARNRALETIATIYNADEKNKKERAGRWGKA